MKSEIMQQRVTVNPHHLSIMAGNDPPNDPQSFFRALSCSKSDDPWLLWMGTWEWAGFLGAKVADPHSASVISASLLPIQTSMHPDKIQFQTVLDARPPGLCANLEVLQWPDAQATTVCCAMFHRKWWQIGQVLLNSQKIVECRMNKIVFKMRLLEHGSFYSNFNTIRTSRIQQLNFQIRGKILLKFFTNGCYYGRTWLGYCSLDWARDLSLSPEHPRPSPQHHCNSDAGCSIRFVYLTTPFTHATPLFATGPKWLHETC